MNDIELINEALDSLYNLRNALVMLPTCSNVHEKRRVDALNATNALINRLEELQVLNREYT